MPPHEQTRRPVFPAFVPAVAFDSANPAALDPRELASSVSFHRELPVVSFADAPALPFVPYHRATWRELHGLPSVSPERPNRRRFRPRPPLTLAACCLLSCANALFVTSATGQAAMTNGIQEILESMSADEMAVLAPGIR